MAEIIVPGENNLQAVIETSTPSQVIIGGAIAGPVGPQGNQGIQGIQGIQGVNGATWYEGVSAPSTVHSDGDLYLNVTTGDVYKQVAGTWGSPVGNIRGPAGANALLTEINVKDPLYGAIGDGVHDDTTSIQSALNSAHIAGGGIVFMPIGTYKITAALTMYSNIILAGAGVGVTMLRQKTADTSAIVLNDGAYSTFKDFSVYNDGATHATGSGIDLHWTSNGNVEQIHLQDLYINGFHLGINAQTLITSQINNVELVNCDTGIYMWATSTSVNLTNTYANGCGIGYSLDSSVYINFSATACDGAHQAYYLNASAGISFNGCGSESGSKSTAPNDGRGWYLTGCRGIALNACWNFANPSYALYLTNSTSITVSNFTENSPVVGSTNGIFVDTNCARITVISPSTTTANQLQSGSNITTLIADFGANTTIPGALTVGHIVSPLTVNGANGNLILNANTDGSQFNLSADASGTLAIYGNSAATLNVEIMDGYLQLDPLTATTVPYLDSNKRLTSSAITPTQLGYLSPATGNTGTGSLVFGTSPTLVTPALGTPSAIVLTNATGLPVSTGLTGLGTGIAAALAIATGSAGAPVLFNGAGGTPTSLTLTNATGLPIAGLTGLGTGVATALAAAVQGSGSIVLATSPTLTTPTLGVATATTINKVTITAPATSATLTIANGSSLVTAGAFSITLTATAATSVTLPVSGTLVSSVTTANGVSASNTAGALSFTLGAITPTTVNALTLAAATTGFTVAGGTTSKTLTVSNTLTLAGTDATTITFQGTDTYVGRTTTDTLSNKRMKLRVATVTQSATPAINTDNADVVIITGLAQAITSMTTSLTGTPNDGDNLLIRITDNGTARAITWGAKFASSGVATLLATTVINKIMTVGLVWDASKSLWICMAVDATGY